MPGTRPHPSGPKMCPCPGTPCSCARLAQPCPGARLTAARLREIGDELQRAALGRAPPEPTAAWKHLSAACRCLLWAVTPAAALAVLVRKRRHL
ncbi:hypothetical protein NDU88_005381 [Pleurodeles waltl]|uniref:Uncharacterized protein n=1 Tax=Pleurodeles waltl TaxID=8319 RepID=A0AAV7LX64_PLEWA|nr:hypothetical protein NDU88_005381 [Pleurodeles waltl]